MTVKTSKEEYVFNLIEARPKSATLTCLVVSALDLSRIIKLKLAELHMSIHFKPTGHNLEEHFPLCTPF